MNGKLVLAAVAVAMGCVASATPGKAMRVGVINWDCSAPSDTWFGGYQTRSLSPAKYRYLTPYYADAKGPDEISYHRRTPQEYDRELQYAIDAGIDYFAYCWYGEDPHATRVPLTKGQGASCENHLWEITWARQFHLKSALRSKIGLCAIILGNHHYTDDEVTHLAEAMREDCYEKVLGTRPLLYIFGDATNGGILSRIRQAARTAGVADPYVVAMHGSRKGLPTTGDGSVQARTAYAPPEPPKGGAFLRFPDMYAAIRRVNAGWIDQGFDIVPAFATGRDHWPRIDSQVPWTANPPMRYASPATERELVECAKDFKAFVDANRAKCPLDHVLTYAWNEFEEGACICPLWAPNGGADTSRLKAFAKVSRIFRGEQGVTAVADDPLPDLADLRKRLPEIFKGAEDSFRRVWFLKRLEAAERLAAQPQRTELMQAELDEFRISFRDALAHWANDPLNPAVQPTVLDVKDFGAVGDGKTDNIPAFDRAVVAVRALGGKPCVLKVGAGDYVFGKVATEGRDGEGAVATKDGTGDCALGKVATAPSPSCPAQSTPRNRTCNVDFTCVTNCVLAGAGPEKTRFLFGIYEAHGINYARSVNSTVQDVDCRWIEAPFAQTVVESYDATNFSAVVRADPRTLRPDDPRYRRSTRAQVCCIFKPDGTKSLDHGTSPFFALKADDLGGGRFRVYFDKRPGLERLRLTPGMYLILPDRDNRFSCAAGPGAEFFNFQRVWCRNARAAAITCGLTHYSTVWRCRTIPVDDDGIVFSSNADTGYNSRGSMIAHCEFHHMCDDGANSLSYGQPIYALEGPRTLHLRATPGRLRPGDVVQILDAMNGRFRATLKVVKREDFKFPNGVPRMRLTFAEDLPTNLVTIADVGVMSDKDRYAISHGLGKVKKAADLLYAPLQFGTGFVCIGNRIHDLRGCGINVQCPHSIVEDNVIENVSLAFKMTGLTQWFEGTPPYDVVVRNNTFRNCQIGVQSYFCDVNGKPAPEQAIRLIELSGNRFENVERPYAISTIADSTVDGRPLVKNPAAEDGMIPFLAITGRPTQAEVRAKVAAMQAQGADSFLIYARSGLELEYMGEEWLKLNEWFCAEAERRSMKVWLYDEYNWPSGTCKGRVPQENDAWRYRELGVFPDGKGGYRWTEAYAPAGWVNVCEPAAIDRFMELTHKVYEKRLARWFRNGTILGIFTDEPGHPTRVTFPDGKPLVAFRNYTGLEDEYKAATGRELRADVERFLRDRTANDVWPTYASLMGRRFRASYFDKLRAWCDKMGVKLTGHMIAENEIVGSARYNGLPLHCLRGETLPGMDEIRTAYDPTGKASPRIEWTAYNVARQAILHRGNQGGLIELFACGPADLTPSVLRQLMWMSAFHGIDHYITCMDVMDEKGLVEKHGYLAPAGPVHPWYATHGRILADEARVAARFARKRVSECEVAVRYPDRLAALAAHAGGKAPNLDALLMELELNQFACRLIGEDEPTDLPLVFGCSASGAYFEERSGKEGLSPADAVALCQTLPRTFVVRETDGTLSRDVMVRTCADGSSAVINLRYGEARTLVAERACWKSTFSLPVHGVKTFAPGELPPSEAEPGAVRSLQDVDWTLSVDRDNLLRVNFDTNRMGQVAFAGDVKNVKVVTRSCAMSYAVTESGRPIGRNEAAPKGEKVLRHDAEPYAFAVDGRPLAAKGVADELPGVFTPLYRTAEPQDFAAGAHAFRIVSGEADQNYFFPALFLAGDFAVRNAQVSPRTDGKVGFGSLADAGYPNFIGQATWRAEVTAPKGAGLKLRLQTGKQVTSVRFCGVDLGVKAWGPFEWEIPSALQGRTGELEISLWTSAQPMFGDENAPGAKWDSRFWLRIHAPDSACGLFAAAWTMPKFH